MRQKHHCQMMPAGAAATVLLFLLLLLGTALPAGAATYTYDALGRLTSVTYSFGQRLTYTYSPSGNLLKVVQDTVPDIWPPRFVGASPANGAEEVPVNKTITASFSENVQPGPGFNSVTLKTGDTVVEVACRIEIKPGSVRLLIDPANNLRGYTTYIVFIPADAVKDTGGNPLEQAHTFSFTTQEAVPTSLTCTGDLTGQCSDTWIWLFFTCTKQALRW